MFKLELTSRKYTAWKYIKLQWNLPDDVILIL